MNRIKLKDDWYFVKEYIGLFGVRENMVFHECDIFGISKPKMWVCKKNKRTFTCNGCYKRSPYKVMDKYKFITAGL